MNDNFNQTISIKYDAYIYFLFSVPIISISLILCLSMASFETYKLMLLGYSLFLIYLLFLKAPNEISCNPRRAQVDEIEVYWDYKPITFSIKYTGRYQPVCLVISNSHRSVKLPLFPQHRARIIKSLYVALNKRKDLQEDMIRVALSSDNHFLGKDIKDIMWK